MTVTHATTPSSNYQNSWIQWYRDARYVIGIMARRKAYFTECDVQDVVGLPPEKYHHIKISDLLYLASKENLIRDTGIRDKIFDNTERIIWIGVD